MNYVVVFLLFLWGGGAGGGWGSGLGMLFHFILSMNLSLFFQVCSSFVLCTSKKYYCLVPLKLILWVFETITIYSMAKNVPNWSMDPISV
jgi:hypothetical protein